MRPTLLILIALTAALGCDDASAPAERVPLAIAGEYVDTFATYHLIDDTHWTWGPASGPQVFEVLDFDNQARWVLARNRPDNAEAPARFSRFDWRVDEHLMLTYCHTITNATTVESAASASADQCSPGDWILLTAVDDERVEP